MFNAILALDEPWWDIFTSPFVQRALIAVLLMGVVLPIIGLNITTKRLSMMGDTLSHTSLVGVCIGLAAGTMPIVTAIAVSIVCGLIIELVRNKFSKFSELTLAIVMSAAIGLTGVLSYAFKNGNQLEAYLFGSLTSVKDSDIWILLGVLLTVGVGFVVFFRPIMYVAYNAYEAKISGLKVKLINVCTTVLSAASIAVSSAIIGSLIVACLLVIPLATALQLVKGYLSTVVTAIIVSVVTGFGGLLLAITAFDLPIGSTIVVIATVVLILVLLGKGLYKGYQYLRIKHDTAVQPAKVHSKKRPSKADKNAK